MPPPNTRSKSRPRKNGGTSVNVSVEGKGMFLALCSGFLAATASLFGKFAMTNESLLLTLCESFLGYPNELDGIERVTINEVIHQSCNNMLLGIRIAMFLLMVVSNVLMWTTITKAFHLCSTTLEVTVINTAANFLFTAVYGQVMFGETLSLLWWCGTGTIILGLLVVHSGNQKRK